MLVRRIVVVRCLKFTKGTEVVAPLVKARIQVRASESENLSVPRLFGWKGGSTPPSSFDVCTRGGRTPEQQDAHMPTSRDSLYAKFGLYDATDCYGGGIQCLGH